MPALGRALGSFESAAALTHDNWPFLAVGVIRLERGPTDETLRRSLDAMQAQTPLLRARVLRDPAGARFTLEGTPRIPLEVQIRRGEGDWQAVAEHELNHHLDAESGPLVRARYLRPTLEDGPAEIVLTFHHAIIDAASGQHWVSELLRNCADPESAARDAGELPPATDSLLPRTYRGLPGGARRACYVARELQIELAYRMRSRHWPAPPAIPATRTCRILPREMATGPTAAVIAEGRRRRVTVNSALNAALTMAVWRRRYRARPMVFRSLAFADLRPYLQPQVSETTLGCHIAMMRYPVELRPGLGFWDIAAAFQERLYRSARRGEKFLATSLTKHVMQATLRARSFRMAETALSYSGSLRLAPAYGPLRVRGLHAFVSDIPVGPEFTALARLDGDRIQWDFLYLAEDMGRRDAEALADDVMELIEDAGRSGHSVTATMGGPRPVEGAA